MSSVHAISFTSDQDLVQLSGYTIYRHPRKSLRMKINENSYLVLHSTYDDPHTSGLDAMTVKDLKTGDIAIIYEGTQDEPHDEDIKTDAGLVLDDQASAQFGQAEVYYKKMEQIYGNIDHVAGNSLGGALANYVAVRTGVHSVTLDPAILPEDVAEQYTDSSINDRIINYYGNYDPLTLAEQAGGYGRRVPGKKVNIDFGIGWMSYLANNHTGYVVDQATGSMQEYVTVGKPGTPSYGRIEFMADRQVASDIWTGETLTAETAGTGKRIKIDTDSMKRMISALDQVILDDFRQAGDYLDHSIRTVSHEGAKIDDRKEAMQGQFESLIRRQAVDRLFDAMSRVRGVLPMIALIREKMIWIRHLDIPDLMLFGLTGRLSEIISQLDQTEDIIVRMMDKQNDLQAGIVHLKQHQTPKLLEGGTNHFFDGVVGELKAHYRIIDQNKAALERQINSFRDQAAQTLRAMTAADQSIARSLASSHGINPMSVHVERSSDGDLEPSKYLRVGMRIRKQILDKNYKDFSSLAVIIIDPVLNAILMACHTARDILSLEGNVLRGLWFEANFIRIPFTGVDNRIREALGEARSNLNRMIHLLDNLGEVVSRAKSGLPDILNAFRPYIEVGLFEGTQYQAVIAYNHAALGTFLNIRLHFSEIAYQLSDNESEAINRLSDRAVSIRRNIGILIDQVQRGTAV